MDKTNGKSLKPSHGSQSMTTIYPGKHTPRYSTTNAKTKFYNQIVPNINYDEFIKQKQLFQFYNATRMFALFTSFPVIQLCCRYSEINTCTELL